MLIHKLKSIGPNSLPSHIHTWFSASLPAFILHTHIPHIGYNWTPPATCHLWPRFYPALCWTLTWNDSGTVACFFTHSKCRSHNRGRKKVGAGGGKTFQTAIKKSHLHRCRKQMLLEWAVQMKPQIVDVKVYACEGGSVRTNISLTEWCQDTTKKAQ